MEETLIYSLKLAVIGLGIVFLSLTVISFCIGLVSWLDRRWEEREEREKQKSMTKTPTIDELTLVLITAAAATIISGRFHIKSVRRVIHGGPLSSSWTIQGRSILHGSHRRKK